MRIITIVAFLSTVLAVSGCPDNGPGAVPNLDGAGDVTGDLAKDVGGTETTDVADTGSDTDPPDSADVADANDTVDANDAGDVPGELADTADVSTELPDTVISDDGPDEVAAELPQEVVVPDPVVTPDNSLCSSPGGSLNIYDIQNPACADHFNPEPVGNPGEDVALSGVIVTGVFEDTIFVQEPQGGPYSGMSIFMHGVPTGGISVGDIVDISGGYTEFFGLTQIYVDEYTITGSGPAPTPYIIEWPHWIATGGPLAEMFEGVLVQVNNVTTIDTMPDCPFEFGEFAVTGDLRIDDMGYYWDARLGDTFTTITGPLTYTFDNHKIEPRDETDLAWSVKGSLTALTKCIPSECQVPVENLGTQQVVINEVMVDPFGSDWGQEWFEIYNPGPGSVDVEGWEVRDCADQGFIIPPGNTTIFPGQYMVLAQTVDAGINGDVGADVQYGEAFYLPNTVGSILLFDGPGPLANLIDQVRLSAFEPLLNISLGTSAERVSHQASGSEGTNWSLGSNQWGSTENKGTPGSKNSATP